MQISVINGSEKYQNRSGQELMNSNYDFNLCKNSDNFWFKDYLEYIYNLVVENSIAKIKYLLNDRKETNLSKYGNLGTKRLVLE